MKRHLKIVVALGAPVFVLGCATGGGFTYSDGPTVSRALSGSSVVGQISDGTSYCEYHDPGSAVFGRDYEVYAGNWEVRGDSICYSYPGQGTDCQLAYINGSRATFMTTIGIMLSQGNIVPGNVCS